MDRSAMYIGSHDGAFRSTIKLKPCFRRDGHCELINSHIQIIARFGNEFQANCFLNVSVDPLLKMLLNMPEG